MPIDIPTYEVGDIFPELVTEELEYTVEVITHAGGFYELPGLTAEQAAFLIERRIPQVGYDPAYVPALGDMAIDRDAIFWARVTDITTVTEA